MIPYNTVTAWGVTHPWITREQIEQDLLLSKAIIDIFSSELLSNELVFRGGTALQKIVLPEPTRYSEDLDFVRTSSGGIGGVC
jgi:predicted nucleotidyltransferase component of viral defense system